MPIAPAWSSPYGAVLANSLLPRAGPELCAGAPSTGYQDSVLPSDRPTGPLRRLLHYFGLANATDDRLSPTGSRRPQPALAPAQEEEAEPSTVSPRRAAVERGARTAMAYFGLADDDEHNRRSRYGEVSSALDRDLDALRDRVAALEAQLDALTRESRTGRDG